MGIYIKGMEMPTENDELRLIIRSNGQVIISHETYYEETEAVALASAIIPAEPEEEKIK